MMLYEGTKLNPDTAMVKAIKKDIKRRNGYCPNKEEKNQYTKCPCRDYRETGNCECGLYVKDISKLINEMF